MRNRSTEPSGVTSAGQSPPADTASLPRLATLVVFLILANLWLSHHFGFGLQGPVSVTAAIGVVVGAMKAAEQILGQPVGSRFSAPVSRFVRRLVGWPFLVVVCLLALPTALTLSTVQVVPESQGGSVAASLQPVTEWIRGARAESKSATGALRFHPVTDPFGREFVLTADGYLPTTITVRSLVGTHVQLGVDVAPSPAVLFRPPFRGSHAFVNDGRFVVVVVESTGLDTLGELQGHPSAAGSDQYRSFLIGRDQAIQPSGDWMLELGASGLDRATENQTMLGWKDPQHVASRRALVPGMRIRAEILSVRGKREAVAEMSIGRAPLQDMLMLEIAEEDPP